MGRNTGGNPGDVRKSALWGSGNRGGEHRSNALWGKGGRGFVTTVLVVALAVPLAAGAGSGPGKNEGVVTPGATFVSAELKQMQQDASERDGRRHRPDRRHRVGQGCEEGRARAARSSGVASSSSTASPGEIRAKDLEKLERIKGLIVTEDAPARPQALLPLPTDSTGPTSSQLWTAESGVNKLWGSTPSRRRSRSSTPASMPRRPTSRDASRRRSTSSRSTYPNAAGDGRGHGTFVAGIAAGSAKGYAGAAPNADIVSLDVMDDRGAGKTSDVIAAAEWIYQNKAAYNIRVANFSLHSGAVNHFWLDPLNVAVEKLWHSGVVVVAAAGNYGTADAASGVSYAPGSNPFVITVGASDIGGTARPRDDDRAPWSAYGRTPDGFWKPEICAPGRVHGRSDSRRARRWRRRRPTRWSRPATSSSPGRRSRRR